MIDIKKLRKDKSTIKQGLIKRLLVDSKITSIENIQNLIKNPETVSVPLADKAYSLDRKYRKNLTSIEELKHKRNKLSKEIGKLKSKGIEDEAKLLIEEVNTINSKIKDLQEKTNLMKEELAQILLNIPNIPDESVPLGVSEHDNKIVFKNTTFDIPDFKVKPHYEIGPRLGILDFERGVKLSGTRFYILKGKGAALQRALINFFLFEHIYENKYEEIYPPFIVREETLIASAQLPKFKENLYRDGEDDIWLIPTAEVPLTSIYKNEILDEASLPLKLVAYTPCFRKEKMSAGKDVRGIKRGHQFDKVELYRIAHPEKSDESLEAMKTEIENLLKKLKLPYRIVELCTADLGFASSKTFDFEVYAAGCKEWLEVSSVSNCHDFQARRANIKFRSQKTKPRFVHTLNGSGLALPRIMIAIMENYQTKDGHIKIPEVLVPFMHGTELI